MTKFEVFKFLHVTAAIIWVGGAILGAFFTERAKKAEPAHRLGIVRDMEFVSRRMFAPAAMAALLFGVLMVLEADVIDFDQTWIILGSGGIVVSTILGLGYLGPQAKKLAAELAAGDAAAGGRLTAISRVAQLDLFVLLVVVWAMVAKPGL